MNSHSIQDVLQQYQFSMGTLVGSTILVLVILLLIFSLFSMIGAKVLKASHPRFGAAILTVLSYFGLSILLGLIYQVLPEQIIYSQFFEIISFIISFIVFSWLAGHFFRTTFVKGMGIALISLILLFVVSLIIASSVFFIS